MTLANKTLLDISLLHHSAQIFEKQSILYCLDANQTLQEVCAEQNLPLQEIEAELLASSKPDYPSVENLPTFLVERFHERLRAIFPEIIQYAHKVEQVHGEHELCPKGLAGHLQIMEKEMYSHMHKEEQVLFPMIIAGQGNFAQMPMNVMMSEHRDHCEAIVKLEELTYHFKLPEDACRSWQHLYKLVRLLRCELLEHIFIENHILFKHHL